MAIWQYSFSIVPKEDLNAIGCSQFIEKEKYYSHDFWQNRCTVSEYQTQLNDILPKGSSWSSSITLFGQEDSNNIEIVTNENVIVEMSFRLDFRSTTILDKVIEFCIYNGLALITEDFFVIPLNSEIIMSVVKNSRQYKKFVELGGNDNVLD